MPIAKANGIEIYYETFGAPDDAALVLINGLGSQLIRWPEGFRDLLVDEGFHVITFDNRDVGLTTKFDSPSASLRRDAAEAPIDEASPGLPYTVDDMADDVAGLLDRLGITKAHIAGQSMGGMIGQVLAIRHSDRVLSLASIMSAMGEDPVLTDDVDVLTIFTEPAATERDEAIEQDVRHRRIMAGRGFPFDEDAMRDIAARTYDRSYAPAGRVRQMLAVRAAPGRGASLVKLTIPIVVIHGTDDRLVPVANGRKMADVIERARLVTIEGMGHDLPKDAWPLVVNAIVANAQKAAVGS
ncbi:MAG: alpha/beta hydrolase [Actinomycetota bacterium]